MSNNTFQHISNESVYVKFNPAGTAFPSNIVNVQQALAAINAVGLGPLPLASETTPGISAIATQAEVDSGVITNKFVSPATLKQRLSYPNASETVYGLARYATNTETLAGASNALAVSPLNLKNFVNNEFNVRTSTEARAGVIKISTQAAALAMTDDTTSMTPKKTQMAIAKLIAQIPDVPSPDPATESITGIVRLATVAQAQQGTIREGYAISPYTFMNSNASQTAKGVVRLGTQAEINSNSATLVVTGATLNGKVATTSTRGLTRLTTQAGAMSGGDSGSSLAWNADVIHQRGGQTINGTLRLNNNLTVAAGGATISGNSSVSGNLNVTGRTDMGSGYIAGRQIVTTNMLTDEVPIGTIIMWAGTSAPNSKWRMCTGGTVSAASYPGYNSVVGTRFGGDASNPGIPDMRGLFVRGAGRGGALNNPSDNGNDEYGLARLAVGCTGGSLGEIQKQQMSYHKHAGAGFENARNDPFGSSVATNYFGSKAKADWDNRSYFTNNGYELAGARDTRGTLSRKGLIGNETRPWNISLNYLIKVQ